MNDLTDRQAMVVVKYAACLDMQKVADDLGITRDSVRKHLKAAGVPTDKAPVVTTQEPKRLDLVEKHRYETSEKSLRAQVKDLTERLAAAEDIRAGILGLGDRIEPICAPRILKAKKDPQRQGIVCHLSDLHVGETVEAEEVMNVNKYDNDIARKRIYRYFDKSTILSTSAWPESDSAPSVVYVLLGGDLISGHGLHPELAETDAGTAYEQCKWAAQYISGGIVNLHLALAEKWKQTIPIIVLSVVGNHGRMTFGKPRAKLASLQSYDTLVADFVEAALKHYPTITHFQPRAFDAYFDIVGWPALLTHGDRMSAGGGTGFIGPAANIVKGHKKVIMTEAQQRRPVRFIFSGHFHTTLQTPWGFGNGAAIGYGEFAKSIRADPEPAQQNYMVFGERLGLIRYQPIVLGVPEEGTIYTPTGGLILPTLRT